MMINYETATSKLKDVLNRIFGESWSLSCPVPGVINSIPVDKHFLYPIASASNQSRPFALVISAMDTGAILILKHCAAEDFVDTTKQPFNEPINSELPEKMSVTEYKDGMRQLRETYEELRLVIFEGREPDEAVLARYLALVERLTPAAHGPFYAAMRGEA